MRKGVGGMKGTSKGGLSDSQTDARMFMYNSIAKEDNLH